MKAVLILFLVTCAFNHSKAMPSSPAAQDSIYTVVEQMPEFPGGDGAFFKFLQKNLHAPTVANDNEIIGKILVRFVVNTDGSATDVQLMRNQYPDWEKEMKRVLSICPKFKPGMQHGKAVKVYFNLPILDPYGTR